MQVSTTLIVNGEPRSVRARRVDELLDALGYGGRRTGIAVAVNGQVIPRHRWAEQDLTDGDTIDVVGAVQGG